MANPFFRRFNQHIYDDQLYAQGMQIVQDDTYSRKVKEDTLYKLIIAFPKRYELYYFMACVQESQTRTQVWYEMCYQLDTNRLVAYGLENLISYLKLLFDADRFDEVERINQETGNCLYEHPDIRFQLLAAALEAKRHRYNKAIELNHRILQRTDIDNEIRFLCLSNCGLTYNDINRNDLAIDYLTKAVRMDCISDKKVSYNNLFLTLNYEYYNPDILTSLYNQFNEYSKCIELFEFRPTTKTKLRIGYVSGDLENHAVSMFIGQIVKHHTMEVHCFSILPIKNPICPNTYDISEMPTAQIAKFIYEKGIDILVDLAGHTMLNRLEVLALNPAPVQMTYIGYPGSTGLSAIQYRITDTIADHPNTKQFYSERLVYMPRCFLLYDCSTAKPNPRKTPNNNPIILGSLNRESKTSNPVFVVWRHILATCPNTQLLILMKDDTEERRQFYMDKLGVQQDRLIFVGRQPTEADYLRLFSQIDILLDTFPYSGTTTTCKALDASIPVITKYHKDYHAHNVSASLMTNTGFPELVAFSDEEYIAITKWLVENPDQIDEYKRTINNRFVELMEPKRFMTEYEQMLSELYEKSMHTIRDDEHDCGSHQRDIL